MRLVSRRRFPETITRIRYGAGSREGLSGKWVDGAPVETELRASVQPVELLDDESVGVGRLRERLKVYVPEADALRRRRMGRPPTGCSTETVSMRSSGPKRGALSTRKRS